MCPLTPGDRAAVQELVLSVDPDDWLLRELDLRLSAPGPDGIRGYGGYVMELPEGRLGYARPGEARLCGLRVAPALQNRGYGTRIIREVLALSAQQRGRRPG